MELLKQLIYSDIFSNHLRFWYQQKAYRPIVFITPGKFYSCKCTVWKILMKLWLAKVNLISLHNKISSVSNIRNLFAHLNGLINCNLKPRSLGWWLCISWMKKTWTMYLLKPFVCGPYLSVTVHQTSESALFSTTSTDHLTLDLKVFTYYLAVKITSDFHALWRPQYQSNLLQIRRISEQVIKGHNKKHVKNNS